MNIKNNSRRRASQEKIEKIFIEMLQTKEISEITVSDICKKTKLNRSTFYANYSDVFELADKIRDKLEKQVANLYDTDSSSKLNGSDWLKLFYHIRDNQLFYKTYFKLCYDDKFLISTYDPKRARIEQVDSNLKYHIEFFRNGLNAIIKMWLAGGCVESPEEMAQVLKKEYRGR